MTDCRVFSKSGNSPFKIGVWITFFRLSFANRGYMLFAKVKTKRRHTFLQLLLQGNRAMPYSIFNVFLLAAPLLSSTLILRRQPSAGIAMDALNIIFFPCATFFEKLASFKIMPFISDNSAFKVSISSDNVVLVALTVKL